MVKEVLEFLKPRGGYDSKIFVDCTLGGAGHSMLVAQKLGSNGVLIGIDQDRIAIEASSKRLNSIDCDIKPRIILVNNNFGNLNDILLNLHIPYVDTILMDLGLSSEQIDNLNRGFSFKSNCVLDMRMDTTNNHITAYDIVNKYSEKDLCRILKNYSDEKFAMDISNNIAKQRKIKEIETSFELVDIIKNSIPAYARRKGGHPAKRTFQALRIEVNKELQMLQEGLDAAVRWLHPGGRLVVISYHSLEDKIVKNCFRKYADRCTCPPDFPRCVCGKKPILKVITKKAVKITEEEKNNNTRSRSAKLRVVEKLDVVRGK